MSTIEFLCLTYLLPVIICVIGFRICIHLREIERDFGNAVITFVPIVNVIIAMTFIFSLFAVVIDYVVNGSYKKG